MLWRILAFFGFHQLKGDDSPDLVAARQDMKRLDDISQEEAQIRKRIDARLIVLQANLDNLARHGGKK